MALANEVTISGRFLRSTRIDVDGSDDSLNGYIFPTSLKQLLLNMAHQQVGAGQGAYTWTGPYGSGKSSLALILTRLLSGSISSRKNAREEIGDDGFTSALLDCLPPKKDGWKTIAMVGELDAPHKAIARQIEKAGWGAGYDLESDSAVVAALLDVAKAKPKSCGGLLLIIDEMGKFLESAVVSSSDVYFFQLLAEAASRSNGRLLVIGVLHQAFQEYASNLAREARDEWAKIQGRFADIPVNISGEEQIELISKAIVTEQTPKSATKAAQKVGALVREFRPSFGKAADKSLLGVWPLNPITALLLGPISRRSYGQNQRSLFSFLSSSEGFGFQDFLHNATKSSACYNPANLWDYLRFNLQPSIAVSADSHHFSNALEAIDRSLATSGSDAEVELLKSIALLELSRQQTGFGATEKALVLSLPHLQEKEVVTAIKSLQEKSLIFFKQYRDAYGISEGSDFDIETAIEEASREVSSVDLTAITSVLSGSIVSAKRHYHETGTMRWCNFTVSSADQLLEHASSIGSSSNAFGLITLVLPTKGESQNDLKKLILKAQKARTSFDHVAATATSTHQLVLLSKEHSILNHLLQNHREIDRDKVARREIRDRLESVSHRIEQEIWRSLDNATWLVTGKKPRRASWAEVNGIVSDLADERYSKAPRIFNELLNRNKPSGSANGALKLLVRAMALHGDKEQLGFEKYPAEKGLFCSIIEANSLHQKIEGKWQFVEPTMGDTSNLYDVWKASKCLLAANNAQSVALTELYDHWRREPFGVRDGLLPLIAVLFLITERSSLAIYLEGVFLSSFSDVDVDYLLKAPEKIQVRWMNMSSLSRNLLSNLADVAAELTGAPVLNLAPLDVARVLIAAFESAAPWVHKTSRLSKNALQIRELFKRSNDPNKFIFDDIPALYAEHADIDSESGIDYVTRHISDGLQEILGRYEEMLGQLRDQVLTELQVHSQSPQAIMELNSRAENIKGISGDFRLDAFIGRLIKFDNSLGAIESLVSMGVNKPAKSWIDNDVDQATVELLKFSQKFNTHEAYARVKGRKDKRESMAVVVSLDGRPVPVLREFNVMESERGQVNKLADDLQSIISRHIGLPQNIALAALATVSALVIGEDSNAINEDEKLG